MWDQQLSIFPAYVLKSFSPILPYLMLMNIPAITAVCPLSMVQSLFNYWSIIGKYCWGLQLIKSWQWLSCFCTTSNCWLCNFKSAFLWRYTSSCRIRHRPVFLPHTASKCQRGQLYFLYYYLLFDHIFLACIFSPDHHHHVSLLRNFYATLSHLQSLSHDYPQFLV